MNQDRDDHEAKFKSSFNLISKLNESIIESLHFKLEEAKMNIEKMQINLENASDSNQSITTVTLISLINT